LYGYDTFDEQRQPKPLKNIISQLEELKTVLEGINNAKEQVFLHSTSKLKIGFVVHGVVDKVVFVEMFVCFFSISPNKPSFSFVVFGMTMKPSCLVWLL